MIGSCQLDFTFFLFLYLHILIRLNCQKIEFTFVIFTVSKIFHYKFLLVFFYPTLQLGAKWQMTWANDWSKALCSNMVDDATQGRGHDVKWHKCIFLTAENFKNSSRHTFESYYQLVTTDMSCHMTSWHDKVTVTHNNGRWNWPSWLIWGVFGTAVIFN